MEAVDYNEKKECKLEVIRIISLFVLTKTFAFLNLLGPVVVMLYLKSEVLDTKF